MPPQFDSAMMTQDFSTCDPFSVRVFCSLLQLSTGVLNASACPCCAVLQGTPGQEEEEEEEEVPR